MAKKRASSEAWTVYMIPSTMTPKYLELRHYLLGGSIARWVIERDGRVSAHNNEGASRELVPVEEVAA